MTTFCLHKSYTLRFSNHVIPTYLSNVLDLMIVTEPGGEIVDL